MYRLVRGISTILFLSLLLGVAVAMLLEARARLFAFGLVAALFTIPTLILYIWSSARSLRLEALSERARQLAGGNYEEGLPRVPEFLSEMARALEELRKTILRQRDLHQKNLSVLGEILNGMGEGLVAIDRDRRLVLANRRFAELSGVTPVLGKPLLEVFRNASLVQAFERALGGKPSTLRTVLNTAGEERQLEMRIFPLATSSEIVAVALLIDITMLARLENIRRNFIADFSHEVRTPLAGLRAAVETLEMRRLDPEQEAQLRGVIGRQLSRLERLVEDVRQLSDIEAGEVVLHKERVDLKQMLEDLCEDFSEQHDGSGPRLRVEGVSSEVQADPMRLQQVFANLIENAYKHAQGATEVRIEVQDLDEVSVARVTDNGAGIPPEEQELIFHRFYRIDPASSQQVGGTGLGLAIAKHLVLLHGGSIAVQSRPGEGASFEVRLPKR